MDDKLEIALKILAVLAVAFLIFCIGYIVGLDEAARKFGRGVTITIVPVQPEAEPGLGKGHRL